MTDIKDEQRAAMATDEPDDEISGPLEPKPLDAPRRPIVTDEPDGELTAPGELEPLDPPLERMVVEEPDDEIGGSLEPKPSDAPRRPIVTDEPDDGFSGPGEPKPSDAPREPVPLWKKVVAVGAWIVAVFALIVAFRNLREEPAPAVTGSPVLTIAPESAETPVESLGIRFDEVRELWNSVDQPPAIAQDLRRTLENGEFDSFRHGFDSSAELIGAYRDSDDYLTALVARASLDHPSVSALYLHMCHLVSPFSPECIDNYFNIGLGGRTLEDLAATGLSNSWDYQGNEWRVLIEGKLLTIRVLAPGTN